MDNLARGKRSTLNHFEDDDRGMVRDYCYVGDVARANVLALNRGTGDYCNIGTGTGTRTLDLYNTIFQEFKKAVPGLSDDLVSVDRRLARPGDLKRSCLVVEKAGKVLGWYPETDLKEGISRTLRWRLNLP